MADDIFDLDTIDQAILSVSLKGDTQIRRHWEEHKASLSCYLTHPDSLTLATSLISGKPWKLDEFIQIGRDRCKENTERLSIKSEDELLVLLSALSGAGLDELVEVIQLQFASLQELSRPVRQFDFNAITEDQLQIKLGNTVGMSNVNLDKIGRTLTNEGEASFIPHPDDPRGPSGGWPVQIERPDIPGFGTNVDKDALDRAVARDIIHEVCERGIMMPQVVGVDIQLEPSNEVCVGGVLTLSLPDGIELPIPSGESEPIIESIVFNTETGGHDLGSAQDFGLTSDNKLNVVVPDSAIQGLVYINFKRGAPQKKGCVIRWPEPYLFTFNFEGGRTTILDFSHSSRTNQAANFSADEKVRVYFSTANVASVTLTVQELDGPARLLDVPAGQSYVDYQVPHFAKCGNVKFTLEVDGPCTDQSSKLKETIEILCDRSYLPTSADVEPTYKTVNTRNFYIHDWETIDSIRPPSSVLVTRPRTISDVANAIRFARRDGYLLAPKSTNSSYEKLTPIDGVRDDSLEIRFIETHACTDTTGIFSAEQSIGEISQYNQLYNKEFSEKYQTWLAALYQEFSRDSTQLRSALNANNKLKSVLSNNVIRDYERFSLGNNPAENSKMTPLSNRLVYLKAGIKLYEVNRILDKDNLALPTMGAGAFQSLGGAIATSTHGANFKLPPLSSFVRAIHLVSDSGQEWWIEPDGEMSITDSIKQANASKGIFNNKCLNVVRSHSLFRSIQVHASLPGFVWAYVIETVPMHYLYKSAKQVSWAQGVTQVQELIDNELFNNNLWFRAVTFSSSGDAWSDEHRLVRKGDRVFPPPSTVANVPDRGWVFKIRAAIFGHVHYEDNMRKAEEAGDYKGIINGLNDAWGKEFGIEVVDDTHKTVVVETFQGCLYSEASPRKSYNVIAEHLLWLEDSCDKSDEKFLYPFEDWDTEQKRKESQPVADNFLKLQRRTTSTEIVIDGVFFEKFASDLFQYTQKLREKRKHTVVYQMNVRVTGKAEARYAMQKWRKSVHIELWTFDGLTGTERLRYKFNQLAQKYRAIRHWGQQMPSSYQAKQLRDPRELLSGADSFKVFGYDLNKSLN